MRSRCCTYVHVSTSLDSRPIKIRILIGLESRLCIYMHLPSFFWLWWPHPFHITPEPQSFITARPRARPTCLRLSMSLSSRLKVILGTGDFRRRGFLEEKEVSALQLLMCLRLQCIIIIYVSIERSISIHCFCFIVRYIIK